MCIRTVWSSDLYTLLMRYEVNLTPYRIKSVCKSLNQTVDGITFISSIKILNLILPRIISSNVIYKWYQAELRLIWLYLFSTVSIFHGKIHLCIPSMMVRGIVQKQNVDYFQYNNLHSHHLHLLQFWTHKFLKYWRI